MSLSSSSLSSTSVINVTAAMDSLRLSDHNLPPKEKKVSDVMLNKIIPAANASNPPIFYYEDPETGETRILVVKNHRALPNLQIVREFIKFASAGNVQAINLMLNAGADINAIHATKRGQTALGIAAAENPAAITALLKVQGRDVNAKDYNGVTPLMDAIRFAEGAIPEFLQAGADVNAEDTSGNTPLTIAIELRNITAVNQLLAKGAWRPVYALEIAEEQLTRTETTDDRYAATKEIVDALRGEPFHVVCKRQ